jgi:hypothetical protein
MTVKPACWASARINCSWVQKRLCTRARPSGVPHCFWWASADWSCSVSMAPIDSRMSPRFIRFIEPSAAWLQQADGQTGRRIPRLEMAP